MVYWGCSDGTGTLRFIQVAVFSYLSLLHVLTTKVGGNVSYYRKIFETWPSCSLNDSRAKQTYYAYVRCIL